VAGSSQNSSSNYDYVVLKYAPDGTQAWAARYAPTNGGKNTVNGFALDQSGNAYLTGTAGTVKVGAGGALAWVAPYAGTSLATDANGNAYVTGFTNQFVTVKLDAGGNNVWMAGWTTYPGYPAASQRVAVDQAGNLYVAGWARVHVDWPVPVYSAYVVKYYAAGNGAWALNWTAAGNYSPCACFAQGLLLDAAGNAYVTGEIGDPAETAKISPTGQLLWWNPDHWMDMVGFSSAAIDGSGNAYLTSGESFQTVKLDSDTGVYAWLSNLWRVDTGYRRSYGIALDRAANIYLCGVYAPGSGSGNDWATVKLDNDGNLLWSKPYNGPANGDDVAVAVAVAPDGSIYVTGYSANTSGGTDITTIKYVHGPTVQPQPGGAMLLQVPGLPGSSAGLGATTDFTNWTELGPVVAGTNGLFQFMDTNAPLFPLRFYRWHGP